MEISEMNIYEKINAIKLSEEIRTLQKDTKNQFGKFNYYDSSTITNTILKLCKKYNLFTQFNFPKNEAILSIINLDNMEEVFEIRANIPDFSPMPGKLGLIMSVGSYHTIMKRYLYLDTFEICEADPEELHDLFAEKEQDDIRPSPGQLNVYKMEIIPPKTLLEKPGQVCNKIKVDLIEQKIIINKKNMLSYLEGLLQIKALSDELCARVKNQIILGDSL